MTVSFWCLVIAGIMAGLVVGLASIDHLTLEIAAKKNAKLAKSAKVIFAVINNHHWMLVTLLLINAACLETLPIYLNKAVDELIAISIAVIGVLFIGQIIPQALCTGPSQIAIAEFACPIVYGLMWLTAPLSWPFAKFLDWMMGEHKVQRFDNDQLKTLILLHSKDALKDVYALPSTIEGLDSSLVNMMTGVMSVEKINIQDILKGLCNINKKYKFYLDTKVDETFIRQVTEIGYSRIPILHSEAYPFFVGVLIV